MSFRDVSKTEELLELYEEEDLLWNTSHEHYYRKDKRKQALNRISVMLGIPAKEVTKKITNLRTYYCKELNKIKQSKLKVPKGGELYVSKWEHFKNMDRFLYPYIQGRKLVEVCDGDNSDDPDDPEEDGGTHGSDSLKQEDAENTVDEDGNMNSSVRKRKHQEEEMIESHPRKRVSVRERLRRMCQGQSDDLNQPEMQNETSVVKISQSKTLQNPPAEDREDVFGKHVANELRLIQDLRTRQLVKLKIQNILFEAQFGCQPEVSSKTSSNSLDLTFPVPTSMDVSHGQSGTYSSHNSESADVVIENVE